LHAPAPDARIGTPDWLPAAVRSYVLQAGELFAEIPRELAILHRVATDPRMRLVWRELRPRAKSDKALVEFFDCAWQLARFPNFVTTPKDRAALAAPWSAAAELCRGRKCSLAAKMNPDLMTALQIVACDFDEMARRQGCLDSPMVVRRHGQNDHVRAYVRVLGNLTEKLFGSVLLRTVARTAAVALQERIDWPQVRHWMKP
jgi:hypothetical protein